MSKAWNTISQSIRDKGLPCKVIGADGKTNKNCTILATQAHHVLFPRDVRWEKWLSNSLNAQPACANCNAGTKTADNWVNADTHFRELVMQGYGEELRAWLLDAPAKVKLSDRWRYYMRELGND